MAQNIDTKKAAQRFEKLLVAIDGSEISDYALNLAIHIGEVFSSNLDLIFVRSSVSSAVATPFYDPSSAGSVITSVTETHASREDLRRSVSKDEALVEERKKLVQASGLQCEAITVESDDVGGEIIKLATRGGYGLVVVGSHGRSGLRSLILGSVSKKVAKESKTSVLVVKSKVDGLPKILAAYDGSDEAKGALYSAAELGGKFQGEIDPVSVISIPITTEGVIVPDTISKWEREVSAYVSEALKILKECGIEKCKGKVIDYPDIPKGLSQEAEAGSYDLIVVGSRGYGRLKSLFWGSVASGVADASKTNVLIVR